MADEEYLKKLSITNTQLSAENIRLTRENNRLMRANGRLAVLFEEIQDLREENAELVRNAKGS